MQHKMGISRKNSDIYVDGKSKIGDVRGSIVVIYDQVSESTYGLVKSLYGDIYMVMRLKDYNKRHQDINKEEI